VLDLKSDTLTFQWNPATVIALQRFGGRLKKESTTKFGGVQPPQEKPPAAADAPLPTYIETPTTINVLVKSLNVKLNKEHQGRRLLIVNLSSITLHITADRNEKFVEVSLRDMLATDPSSDVCSENRRILFTMNANSSNSQPLMRIKYKSRAKSSNPTTQHSSHDDEYVAKFHMSGMSSFSSADFDSFLQIEMGSVSFNYLHGRVAELIDYLSNGLPGKGMGLTSKATQNFLKRKDKTNSSLHLIISPPTLAIPTNAASPLGVSCQLGEISVMSWYEARRDGSWRILDLNVKGFGGGDVLQTPVDFALKLDKLSKSRMVEKGGLGLINIVAKVSMVDILVRYSEWQKLRVILRENFGDIDERSWENIEREAEQMLAEGARRVRYGKKISDEPPAADTSSAPEATSVLISAVLELERMSVTLHRDDELCGTPYDLARIDLTMAKTTLSVSSNSAKVFDFSCMHVKLTDLAERNLAFSTLIEGFDEDKSAADDPLPRIVVQCCSSPTADPSVSLVFNQVVVNLLIQPMVEITEFIKGRWTPDREEAPRPRPVAKGDESSNSEPKNNNFKIKVSAHNPRFFLLADETDVHSRALVLRGLAMLEASFKEEGEDGSTTSVKVFIHALESYVNPDVCDALGERKNTNLGIALIEPVYASMELSQRLKPLHPNQRTVNISMEPLSTLLSSSDFELIENLLKRWSNERGLAEKQRGAGLKLLGVLSESGAKDEAAKEREREAAAEAAKHAQQVYKSLSTLERVNDYEVKFRGSKLGLMLRKKGRLIVVEECKNPEMAGRIGTGDVLLAINGDSVRRVAFNTVITMLKELPRPLRVSFSGSSAERRPEEEGGEEEKAKQSNNDMMFAVTFHKPSTGLKLGGCPHGDNIVGVRGVDLVLFEFATLRKGRVPRVGAIILEVNGVSTSELSFEQAVQLCSVPAKDGQPLVVTFAEIPSSVLPTVDIITAKLAGIHLTLIDDADGRDLPLVKGNLLDIIVVFERGVGKDVKWIVPVKPMYCKIEAWRLMRKFAACGWGEEGWFSDNIKYHKSHAIMRLALSATNQ